MNEDDTAWKVFRGTIHETIRRGRPTLRWKDGVYKYGYKMEEGVDAVVHCTELGLNSFFSFRKDCSIFQVEDFTVLKSVGAKR